jgi:hypothetical protein
MGFPPFNPNWLTGDASVPSICVPLNLDGIVSGTFHDTDAVTLPGLTTALPDDIIIVIVAGMIAAGGPGLVAANIPTGSTLVFDSPPDGNFHAGQSTLVGTPGIRTSFFWAPANSPLVNEIITVTTNNPMTNGCVVAFALNQAASLVNPFDSSSYDGQDHGAHLEIETSQVCTAFVYAAAGVGAGANAGAPTGYTAIVDNLFEDAGGSDGLTLSISMANLSAIVSFDPPRTFLDPSSGSVDTPGCAIGMAVLGVPV